MLVRIQRSDKTDLTLMPLQTIQLFVWQVGYLQRHTLLVHFYSYKWLQSCRNTLSGDALVSSFRILGKRSLEEF